MDLRLYNKLKRVWLAVTNHFLEQLQDRWENINIDSVIRDIMNRKKHIVQDINTWKYVIHWECWRYVITRQKVLITYMYRIKDTDKQTRKNMRKKHKFRQMDKAEKKIFWNTPIISNNVNINHVIQGIVEFNKNKLINNG